MSYDFPESPLLLYPSLVKATGLNAAVLLTCCHQYATQNPVINSSWILSRQQWLSLGQFWNEEQLNALALKLSDAGYLNLITTENSEIIFSFPITATKVEPEAAPAMQRLPVVEPEQLNRTRQAPTFGGSTGWARSEPVNHNQLQTVFIEKEQINNQLYAMTIDWLPSQTFYDLLAKQPITRDFADSCLDEFRLYWIGKNHKEINWDQKFLTWINKGWVIKQSKDAREQRISNEQQANYSYENHKGSSRSKREQLSRAVMDINNIDW